MKTPFIILIAGPNGIGKTSFATWYLQRYRDCSGIIDPDEIARSNVDSIDPTVIFTSITLRCAMSGLSMTPNETLHESSPQEVVDSLRSELLSGDEDRARVAAAFIRSSYAIRAQYRQAGMGLALLINGKVESVDPDSPLLPDLTSLVPLVLRLFPLPPEEEPPGFLL